MTGVLGALNLFDPTHVAGAAILVTAFLLGAVHGITPDEHTWPITFSYAVGGYSSRRGVRAGLTFSAAFTLQRALASELAYLGLSRVFTFASADYVTYLVVGALMVAAGVTIVRRRRTVHLHLPWFRSHDVDDHEHLPVLNDPRPWMPAVHGFVAGWGFGAFAVIIYTVLAPAEHSAALGWLPGACFGLGTMAVQVLVGGIFGLVASRRGLPAAAIRRVALKTAANTLTWGGAAFVAAGIAGLAFPAATGLAVTTGVHVHNLDHVGIATVLAIGSVMGIGLGTLVHQTRAETRVARAAAGEPIADAAGVPQEPTGAPVRAGADHR